MCVLYKNFKLLKRHICKSVVNVVLLENGLHVTTQNVGFVNKQIPNLVSVNFF